MSVWPHPEDWDTGATFLKQEICRFRSAERKDKHVMWADKQIYGPGFGLKTSCFPTLPVLSFTACVSLSEVQLSSISPVNNRWESGGK